MVAGLRGRRGKGTLGCLLSAVLFAGALHYGLSVGRVYHRYLKFKDAMRGAAISASTRGDEAIRRTLVTRADDLGLPGEAKRLWIRRSGPPPRIEIHSWYDEQLNLPFGQSVVLTFHPMVEHYF